ncbi:IclR family transcriptional regulator [Rubellicoccus peritrichatus]|uniref:IclR family transcriptional regulator n=1 Tax=Rubellicoccus peritrichatus TaxID=3080537 RepID=A0AAQ3QVF4_9BACT|nr:IclR family transcriptional regulator [Puniceicoccus sp. CR14]WOO40757.1 IclR family transcriptional regulator [Puniceicoccus sp. CR14]
MSESKYSAPALEKGLDILEFLAAQPVEQSQADIAQALGRTQSEIYRMLSCLEARGYVIKGESSGCYRLSLRVFELGHQQSTTSLLRRAARLPMDTLAEEIGQACHLSVEHGASLLILLESMPRRRICLAVGEGTILPLLQTASGKVLLSRMDDEEIERILGLDEDYASRSEKWKKMLAQSIADARRDGYVVTESELTVGAQDVSVPIGVAGTDTSATLAISSLQSNTSRKAWDKTVKAVRRCAAEINSNLGIAST